jgi:hypothetical protein
LGGSKANDLDKINPLVQQSLAPGERSFSLSNQPMLQLTRKMYPAFIRGMRHMGDGAYSRAVSLQNGSILGGLTSIPEYSQCYFHNSKITIVARHGAQLVRHFEILAAVEMTTNLNNKEHGNW